MSDQSIPTLDEVLRVLGSSKEEIADWSSTVATSLQEKESIARWEHARVSLDAPSKFGPLFGVTSRDIRSAARRLASPGPTTVARFTKRTLDIVVSLLALITVAPVLLAAAIAIVIDSPGPVLWRAQRVGPDGKRFGLLQFRTMRVRPLLSETYKTIDPERLRQHYGIDPKFTRVGKILRSTSIDILPQFVNILKGDMSLVGPRPVPAPEADASAFRVTSRVRAGFTGLWRVSGRKDLTWSDTVKLDTLYVENWSLSTDIALLLRTATAIIRGKPF